VSVTDQKPKTVRALLGVAAAWLGEQGVEGPELETQLLLAHVLGCKRIDLFMDHDRPLVPAELERFRALMRRRGAQREPLAYLIGERDFYTLTFYVQPGVLIPRPESEHLVELALEALPEDAPARFADVGTGSGCVGLCVAKARPQARGLLLDVSADALSVARRNAERHGFAERVDLVRADLLSALADASLDVVVSNPPYVGEDETDLLAPEVRDHEPHRALFDRPGLPITERLVQEAARVLSPGGLLAVETGYQSAELVEGFFAQAGFTDVRRVLDLSGIERIVAGRRPA
jgi:release factor glutamine methyltransferase